MWLLTIDDVRQGVGKFTNVGCDYEVLAESEPLSL